MSGDWSIGSPAPAGATALSQATSAAAGDLFTILKVGSSTPPANAAGSNQVIPAASLLIPLQATGSAGIDTPLVQAAIASGQPLAPGSFAINATLTLDTNQVLAGSGQATILTAVSGFTGSFMVAVKTASSSIQTTIRDLQLVPSTGSVGGIDLDNTGLGGGDPQHAVLSVYINNSAGDAFKFGANIRSCLILGCQQYGSGGYGFNIGSGCTDNWFIGCLSGPSLNHGFNITDSNNTFVSCKAFFAGWNGAALGTTEAGFYVDGTICTEILGCQAQQNALHGFDLQGCQSLTMTGCDSDSNGAGTGVTTGCGVNTNGVTHSTVSSITGLDNSFLTPHGQKYGIQVAGTQTGLLLIGNSVTGSSGPFNYVSGFGSVILDGNQVDLSQSGSAKLPVTQMTGGLSPAVAALTFVGGGTTLVNAALGNAFNLTLTASTTTLGAPSNPVDGQVIRFRITQGAGGSFTLAYASAYDFGAAGSPTLSTTAGKVDLVAFEYSTALSKWMFLGAGLGY